MHTTLINILPEAFYEARENTKHEESELLELLQKKKKGTAGIDALFRRLEKVQTAYHDLVRFIDEWESLAIVFASPDLEKITITEELLRSLLKGSECFEKSTVTLEDGRLYRKIETGYYAGEDGSVIAAVDLVRIDENHEWEKIICRLGYYVYRQAGTYDPSPY